MKALALTLITLAFANVSEARDIKTLEVDHFSQHSFYNCDYVEDQTRMHLKALGAEDITVLCDGGLPDFNFVHVYAAFTVATPADAGATFQTVTIKTRESCDLNEKLLNAAFAAFTVHGEVERTGQCWDAKGDLKYSAHVLR